MSERETFGSHIKGARLGYRWLDEVERYVRLSDRSDGFLIELAKSDALPRSGDKSMYRCWWDDGDGWEGRKMLVDVVKVRLLPASTQRIVLDMDGVPA